MTSTASAIKAGGGAELWKSSSQRFDDAVLDDLINKIFGNEDPVTYIKTNGAGDYNTYGKNSPNTAERGTPYYVVPASTINANPRIKNTNNGLVVTLGGKEWMAASLTLANVGSTTDNVILTLYLANSTGSIQYYTSSANTKGNNMYSSSTIRNHLLTNSNWSLFNTTSTGSFAEKFLVQPKNVTYQRTETQLNREASWYNYNNSNDALGTLSSGWASGISYVPTYSNKGAFSTSQSYDAWGEDYIWLPSAPEAGYQTHLQTTSIWKLSATQLNTSSFSWLRSGGCTDYAQSYVQKTSSNYAQSVSSPYAIRPAIHLNLSAAGLGKRLDNPSDITTTYNTNPQTLKTIYAATPSLMSWYVPNWYEHASNYVTVTYYDKSNAPSTSVTNEGDYWVKVDIANWVTASNPRQLPRFKGDPDTSDSTHTETDTVRWFKITVNKAEVDFSKVTWSATQLEFNGTRQEVTVASGFPSFLSPSYTHPASTNVGNYTTRVSGVTVTDSTAAANYNIPTSAQLSSYATLNHSWQIVKKRVTITWKMPGQEAATGTGIYVPVVEGDTVGAVEVIYYAADQTTVKTLAEIAAEYDAATQTNYYAFAQLKAATTGGSVYNATNCELYEGSTNVTSAGSYFPFQTGGDKTPITVGISPDRVTYNGSAQPVSITFSMVGLTVADFHVSYTMKDGTAIPAGKADRNGVPIGAGEYKAKIELDSSKTDDYAIAGRTEFDYTIDKADYDLSGFKWVDETNTEYTASYTWAYGVSHTLKYDGAAMSGLTYNYALATEPNLRGSNAGSYNVVVQYTVADSDNYNKPTDLNFTWEIAPYVPDLSAVKWNFDNTYTYKMEGGAPAEYEVHLENLPAGLADLIDYTGDTGKYSNAGSYTTMFTIDESDPMRANFGALNFPATALPRLVWEIKSLTFEKPTSPQTETYRDGGYTFQNITNFPDDWAQYFSVEIVDSDETVVAPVGGSWTLVNVDQYYVNIQFQDGMNTSSGGSSDNVKWTDNGRGPWQVIFNLEQLVLPVKGWVEQGENVRPQLDAEPEILSQIEKYFDYVLVNAETNTEIPVNSVLDWETVYTIALRLKPEYAGNVAVEYMGTQGEETAPYPFMTAVNPLAPPPTNFYRKPTDEEAHVYYRYTGKEVAFTLGAWFVEDKMQILASAGSAASLLKGTEEGDYIVRVGFKKGARSAWEPASAVPADRAPVTITFTISKDAKLGDRFILKDGITVPFAFLYDDFTSVGAIEDYEFDSEKLAYVSRLALGDTLSALLSQFENGADITVYDLDGTTVITDLETVVATGMYLRLMDGDTMLNQLILAVLGEITGDGIINLKDKAQLNSYTLGTTKLAPAQLLASDITGDGIINLKDKAQLNSYTLGTNALPVTPIPVPAPSSVSEVWEGAETFANGERSTVSAISSLSKITEEVPARTTSAEVAKADCTTVATNHRAATPQFVFPPDSAKKKYPK